MEKAHVDVPSFFAFPVRGWHNIRIFRGCREGRGASFHHQPDFAMGTMVFPLLFNIILIIGKYKANCGTPHRQLARRLSVVGIISVTGCKDNTGIVFDYVCSSLGKKVIT